MASTQISLYPRGEGIGEVNKHGMLKKSADVRFLSDGRYEIIEKYESSDLDWSSVLYGSNKKKALIGRSRGRPWDDADIIANANNPNRMTKGRRRCH